jgi:hypothetical protein
MKSRLVLSLAVLAAVLATSAYGAFAYFTAQAETSEIKITTGHAGVALTDCDEHDPRQGALSLHGFDFPNGLVPGDGGRGCFRVWDTGQGGLQLSFKTGNVNGYGSGLENVIEIAVGRCPQDTVAGYASGSCLLNENDPLQPGESLAVDYTYLFPDDRAGDQNGLQDGTLTFNAYVDAQTVPQQ